MIKLARYELTFDPTIAYLKEVLENANTLSSLLIKKINFKSGTFFTLLTEKTNSENIHKFRQGGIACNSRDQTRSFVLNKLQFNDNLTCVFDDVSDTYRPGCQDSLFLSHGYIFQNEIYYLITKNTASLELLEEAFYVSDALWHSLCVLCEIKIINDKTLSLKNIEDICLNAQLIIVGAFDAEGYIFWEKSP